MFGVSSLFAVVISVTSSTSGSWPTAASSAVRSRSASATRAACAARPYRMSCGWLNAAGCAATVVIRSSSPYSSEIQWAERAAVLALHQCSARLGTLANT